MVYPIGNGIYEFPYYDIPLFDFLVDHIKCFRALDTPYLNFGEKLEFFYIEFNRKIKGFHCLHNQILSDYYYRLYQFPNSKQHNRSCTLRHKKAVYNEAIKYLAYTLEKAEIDLGKRKIPLNEDHILVYEFYLEFFQFELDNIEDNSTLHLDEK